MAVTGFWPVFKNLKATLDYADNPDKTTAPEYLDDDLYAALRYAENDDKTDRKIFVGGINCSAQNAYAEMIAVQRRFGLRGKVVGYHGIQSFREGEVTPEQAFAIGKETARRMWGDRYQVLVSVHLNTDNVHCHFVVNPVSFKDGAKFKNKIGDHKELRKISDEICREHELSVLENSEFYSKGKKKEYWVHKAGKQTHRDMLRRDVEEALAKCGSFREIEYYLKCLGYRFQRDFHYAHPSVIIDGWQRPIRIDSLGPQFSREAIRERCLENQRKPELYGYAYPQRKRAPLLAIEYHLRQAQRQDTVTLLFEIFIELLKICTGSNIENTNRRPLSPAMRAEVRKLDQYLEEYKLLCDHRIESPKELLSFQEGLTARISALEEQRYALRLKLRRVKSPEEEAGLKEHCKKITKELTPLRRERKTVLRIAEHIPKIQELLDAERKTEICKHSRRRFRPLRRVNPEIRTGASRYEETSEYQEVPAAQYPVCLYRPLCHQAGAGVEACPRHGFLGKGAAPHGGIRHCFFLISTQLPPHRPVRGRCGRPAHSSYRVRQGQKRQEIPQESGIRLCPLGQARGYRPLRRSEV